MRKKRKREWKEGNSQKRKKEKKKCHERGERKGDEMKVRKR